MTSKTTPSITSSQASAAGPSPSATPDGQTTAPSGQAPAPANPTPKRAGRKATPTPGTCGPTSIGSSESLNLTCALASRLQVQLATVGSMEYRQTWKLKATPAGRWYWAHTASGHPTSASEFFGWPKTPHASDGEGGVMEIRPGTTGHYKLRDWVMMVCDISDVIDLLIVKTGRSGGYRMSPIFSKWLMGFPPVWCDCGVTATPSSLKSPPNLLKRM